MKDFPIFLITMFVNIVKQFCPQNKSKVGHPIKYGTEIYLNLIFRRMRQGEYFHPLITNMTVWYYRVIEVALLINSPTYNQHVCSPNYISNYIFCKIFHIYINDRLRSSYKTSRSLVQLESHLIA